MQIKDADRKLTSDGEQKIKSATEGWKLIILSFSHIISSPLVRAVQTAEIIANTFGFKEKILTDKRLSPGSKTQELTELANEIMGQNMAFIGHEPDFSYSLSDLISNSGVKVDFKKGMIAKISFDGKAKLSRGVLEFLIPAKAYK
jgi:phosphohistidine phosphatase